MDHYIHNLRLRVLVFHESKMNRYFYLSSKFFQIGKVILCNNINTLVYEERTNNAKFMQYSLSLSQPFNIEKELR